MKKSTYLSLLLILPLFFSFSTLHEYYVSVTKVDFVKSKKSIQITNQLFIDDFEALLRERYDDNITLAGDDEPKIAETYIERYLTDKIEIKVNGKLVSIDYIGREYKDDIVYSYLEITNVLDVKSISITNEVLLDMFTEQQNIIKTNINFKKKSFLLTSAKTSRLLNFD